MLTVDTAKSKNQTSWQTKKESIEWMFTFGKPIIMLLGWKSVSRKGGVNPALATQQIFSRQWHGVAARTHPHTVRVLETASQLLEMLIISNKAGCFHVWLLSACLWKANLPRKTPHVLACGDWFKSPQMIISCLFVCTCAKWRTIATILIKSRTRISCCSSWSCTTAVKMAKQLFRATHQMISYACSLLSSAPPHIWTHDCASSVSSYSHT